jgi:hypothetical protein
MSGMAQIAVSLSTWKAIEAQRLSFEEDHDSIIRRALIMKASRKPSLMKRTLAASMTVTRKRGNLAIEVAGRQTEVPNLKTAYIAILSQLVKRRPSLFQQLLKEGSNRRRWIAMTPAALFPLSPHLAQQHAYRIAPDWYVDTNLSRAQIETRIACAAKAAGLSFGDTVQVIDKN